ncbi:hypothetical protein PGT21_028469 [Puccinia graminis f. sp. tritici]|uniref:Uncharacterized protein n=1 Tax=Puccinia graminis f. sp. tritici TaxID=56615 RepID=A0A5B0QXS4_PUCGR|nr:hypothetical protein PGT21_028469 [Puccinia graminis f. sp. tritici]
MICPMKTRSITIRKPQLIRLRQTRILLLVTLNPSPTPYLTPPRPPARNQAGI